MRVVLGVGGGIAAYKAAEIARSLQDRGCTVQVVMTAAACRFIQPLTFAALTGRNVITSLWSAQSEDALASAVEHIQVAQENDTLLVAPATADLMARFANGLADDFLTTMFLAFTGRVVLAPAMNTNMWNHPATVQNIETLRRRGAAVLEPDEGLLACGTTGPGRLPSVERIVDAVAPAAVPVAERPAQLSRRDLEGETIIVTAGPTQEPLDPVRFISNRSSGKMGYALAQAASARGARVTLVSGPVQLPEPDGMLVIHVKTATEMRRAVLEHLPDASIIIKAAAVADYHLAVVPKQKMKKTAARMSLELDPTPDILAEVGQKKGDRLLIGFAAETDQLVEEARRKLVSKNCDMVVANLVNRQNLGFDADDNEVTLVLRTGESIPLPQAHKRDIADSILDHALKLRLALHAAAS